MRIEEREEQPNEDGNGRGTPEREDGEGRIVYAMDERPPWPLVPVYAIQHIFAMIMGSITGAVVIGTTIGLTTLQIGQLVGIINFAVGIATILQVKWGVRYPVIQGSTMGHVPAYISIGAIAVALYDDPVVRMQYLVGALMLGAVFEAVFGFAGLVRYVRRTFSPITIGLVIMMVGLGLWPVVNDFIGGQWHIAVGVFVLVMIATFALGKTSRTMAIFSAVIVAYTFAAIGTWVGWFREEHALWVDFPAIAEATWLQLPRPFPWGWPRFNWGFVLAMILPYIATMLESTGDYFAVARAADAEQPTVKRVGRGLGTEGVASLINSVLGGTATSSFSQNVGVVRITGVASLFVCVFAGVILMALGVVGKLGAILGSVPQVILGAVYLVAFGVLAITGLGLVLRADISAARNETIVGTSLLLGLALPGYMRENPLEIAAWPAAEVFTNVFLATPMMVAGVWAYILDNVVPGSDKERGLEGWFETAESQEESEPTGRQEHE